MVFVPSVPRQTASPEAQDLANRINVLIRDYQRDHPGLSERDVRDAIEAASGAGPRRTDRRAGAVIAALVAVFVGAGTFLQQGGSPPSGFALPVIAVAVLVAVVVATVARRRP